MTTSESMKTSTRMTATRMSNQPSTTPHTIQRDVSAGGAVVRCTPDGLLHVVVCHRAETGLWALPKGTPEPGETREETARREVQEETGLHVTIIGNLGSVRYTFEREGILHDKEVYHYVMEPIGGSLDDHDSEFDHVEWMPLDDTTFDRMTYDTDVEILKRALLAMAPDPDKANDHAR